MSLQRGRNEESTAASEDEATTEHSNSEDEEENDEEEAAHHVRRTSRRLSNRGMGVGSSGGKITNTVKSTSLSVPSEVLLSIWGGKAFWKDSLRF